MHGVPPSALRDHVNGRVAHGINAVNKETIDGYFDLLEETLNVHEFSGAYQDNVE